MATAAAIYPLRPEETLDGDHEAVKSPVVRKPEASWKESLNGVSRLRIPDVKMTALYDAAVCTLVLLSPLEIYPGPFYYKRFWFRDAVFILQGLLTLGLLERAERAIEYFLTRQTITGYFESQKGEWDSNGQVLWIF